MEKTLKVQPEVMSSKAVELSTEKTTITGLMDEAKSLMTSLSNDWKSEASDEFQSRFKQTYDDIDRVLSIVDEYISDLNEAAGIYSEAERSAKGAAEGLPTDNVFRT